MLTIRSRRCENAKNGSQPGRPNPAAVEDGDAAAPAPLRCPPALTSGVRSDHGTKASHPARRDPALSLRAEPRSAATTFHFEMTPAAIHQLWATISNNLLIWLFSQHRPLGQGLGEVFSSLSRR